MRRKVKNLEDVWAFIWLHIDESAVRLSEAQTALDLNMLVLICSRSLIPGR